MYRLNAAWVQKVPVKKTGKISDLGRRLQERGKHLHERFALVNAPLRAQT